MTWGQTPHTRPSQIKSPQHPTRGRTPDTEDGASKFTALTADAAEREPQGAVALLIEGDVLSSPVVTQPFTGGSLMLAGGWNEAEARAAADDLHGNA